MTKIVYTGSERGGMFCPTVMNHVFYPGVAVDAPDKKETHRLIESRDDFEYAPEESEAVQPSVPKELNQDIDDFGDDVELDDQEEEI